MWKTNLSFFMQSRGQFPVRTSCHSTRRARGSQKVIYGTEEIQFVWSSAWLCEPHSWTLLVSTASNGAAVFSTPHKRQHIKRIMCTLTETASFFCMFSHSCCSDVFETPPLSDVRAKKEEEEQAKHIKMRANRSCFWWLMLEVGQPAYSSPH